MHSGLLKLIASLPYSTTGGQAGLTVEDGRSLWEGLSRLTVNLDTETAGNIGYKLVEPLLVCINDILQGV